MAFLLFTSFAFAGITAYQVTGPVLEIPLPSRKERKNGKSPVTRTPR